MKYLSVCSGIEAATVAWHDLGWKSVGFSEIEAFPSAVLAHHYPTVPNLGDMTKYKEWNIEQPDLLVGGTPCQSFSVAGLRKGLEDPRGNLALIYCGILDHFRPKWFVWENVPGVLSSAGGRDFGSFLGALAQLGYGFAYRVLDAQFFRVAQRRRRVFVVGHLGDWRPAAAVLFERQSLRRDTAPSREKREKTADSIAKCLTARGAGAGNCDLETSNMIPVGIPDVMSTLLSSTAGISRPGNAATEHETYIPMVGCIGGQHPNAAIDTERSPTLTNAMGAGGGHVPLINQPIPIDSMNHLGRKDSHSFGDFEPGTPTMRCGSNYSAHLAMAQSMAVRRLTPIECERLQGFPDNYTEIPWRGKAETPDGPRYKALGNSMAVPVMRWIGNNIDKGVNHGSNA